MSWSFLVEPTRPAIPPRPVRIPLRLLLLLSAVLMLMAGCNGGQRPTLVQGGEPTPPPPLELALPPAPTGVEALPPASADAPLESSVDDALIAWAADRGVAYTDSCERTTPGPGELCDVATERDTVRLLGPNADDIWYVVRVDEITSLDAGTGYRVAEVDIAGRN